jgi:hypothetical protein
MEDYKLRDLCPTHTELVTYRNTPKKKKQNQFGKRKKESVAKFERICVRVYERQVDCIVSSQATQSNLALHCNIHHPSHHIASLQCKGRKSNQVRM